MGIQREKILAMICGLVLLVGVYRVLSDMLRGGPNIPLPDITLADDEVSVARPRFSRFRSSSIPTRNPFQFSEGWRPVEAAMLPLPPITFGDRVVPALVTVDTSGDATFAVKERIPAAAHQRAEPAKGGKP
jgi:hypothetical protein